MVVHLKHLPAQDDFYHCEDLDAAFVGGVGTGKTHVATDWIITRMIQYPKARHFLFSNTYPQLRAGTLKTFYERVDNAWKLPYVDRVRDFKEIRFPSIGAVLEVWSADQPINYKSLEMCSVWIDEAQAWDKETYDRVINRLRGTDTQRRLYPGMPLMVRITANPPWTMDHWLVDLCTTPSEETGRPKTTLFTASTYDNPFIPQSSINRLLDQYDPELAEIELGGKFGDIGRGRIWRRFSRGLHVLTPERAAELGLPRLEWDVNVPVCWSHDFNIDPLSSVLFQWRRVNVDGYQPEVMYILDEMRIRSALIDDAVKEFQNRPAAKIARRAGLTLYGDPAGNQGNRQTGISDWAALKQGLARAGFAGAVKLPNAPPSLIDRHAAGNMKFRDGHGRIGVAMHPRCVYVPRDFERQYYKPGTRVPFVKPVKDGVAVKLIGHLADAATYPIAYEYPIVEGPSTPNRPSL